METDRLPFLTPNRIAAIGLHPGGSLVGLNGVDKK
jgi:hypothetical protein